MIPKSVKRFSEKIMLKTLGTNGKPGLKAGLFRATIGRLLSHWCHVAHQQFPRLRRVPVSTQKKWGALLPPKDCWGLASSKTPRDVAHVSTASSENSLCRSIFPAFHPAQPVVNEA